MGEWQTSGAVLLTGSFGADSTTAWTGTIHLPSDVDVSYKFFKLQTDGNPVWEEDPNRNFHTQGCNGAATEEGGVWHTGSPTCTTIPVGFEVKASTTFGEVIFVVGSVPELGSWATSNSFALSVDGYSDSNPVWKGTFDLGIGQEVEYKFVKLLSDGTFS